MTPRAARVRPELWEDLLAAIDFYNAARPGLGEEFAEDVRANVRRVAENPESYPVIRRPFRRMLLRRFGQLIVYAVDPDHLYFLGIIHGARDFARWLKARA